MVCSLTITNLWWDLSSKLYEGLFRRKVPAAMLYGEKGENLESERVLMSIYYRAHLPPEWDQSPRHSSYNWQGSSRLKKIQLICHLAVRDTASILSSVISWKRPDPEMAELEKEIWNRQIPFCNCGLRIKISTYQVDVKQPLVPIS